MNALQPLMALLAQAERERDLAAAEAQRTLQAQQRAATQTQQLFAYRAEYEQRWNAQFKTDGRIELLRCYRGFMDRLSHAIEQQQLAAQCAAGEAERARNALTEHELRVASVRKLIDQRRRELALVAERQEQRQTDEFAARTSWNAAGTTVGLRGIL